jgi:hypothetical protein
MPLASSVEGAGEYFAARIGQLDAHVAQLTGADEGDERPRAAGLGESAQSREQIVVADEVARIPGAI